MTKCPKFYECVCCQLPCIDHRRCRGNCDICVDVECENNSNREEAEHEH